jgi:CubicO group peptidase (beta-lactamase class C family)
MEKMTTDVQRRVQEAIDRLVDSGSERGLQVAVYRHGEPVVDAVAGVADPSTQRAVAPETPFYCFSVVKGAAATLAHRLAERGPFGEDVRAVRHFRIREGHGGSGLDFNAVAEVIQIVNDSLVPGYAGVRGT